jgi:adenylate cyclase
VPQEIERKFLVAGDAWHARADRGRRLRQAYLAETDRAVVRIRVEDESRAVLTIKSAGPGLSRQEFEYEIPVEDAEALMALRHGSVLDKTRFHVSHEGRRWEVDVYGGENQGLVIAEVELESEHSAVQLPSWLGREVTGEPRYYAARLSREPYRSWSGEAERGN